MSAEAQVWVGERNLSLQASKKEVLIYLLGRIGKEKLPPELVIYLATNLWSVSAPRAEG